MILEIAEFAMNESMRFSKFLNNIRLQKFHLDNSTSEDVFYDTEYFNIYSTTHDCFSLYIFLGMYV